MCGMNLLMIFLIGDLSIHVYVTYVFHLLDVVKYMSIFKIMRYQI